MLYTYTSYSFEHSVIFFHVQRAVSLFTADRALRISIIIYVSTWRSGATVSTVPSQQALGLNLLAVSIWMLFLFVIFGHRLLNCLMKLINDF